MNAVLRVDHERLAHRIRLRVPLRIDILVHRGGARPSEQAGVLLDVLLHVRGALRRVDVQVDGLVFGVVRAGAGDGRQDVEG